jgi:hypothetical protein
MADDRLTQLADSFKQKWSREAYGAGEAGASMLSGMAAAPAAVVTAGVANDANAIQPVQQAMTYEPRTAEGQRDVQAIGAPFQWLAEKGGQAGQMASDAAEKGANAMGYSLPASVRGVIGSGIDTSVQSLPMLLGAMVPKVTGLSIPEITTAQHMAADQLDHGAVVVSDLANRKADEHLAQAQKHVDALNHIANQELQGSHQGEVDYMLHPGEYDINHSGAAHQDLRVNSDIVHSQIEKIQSTAANWADKLRMRGQQNADDFSHMSDIMRTMPADHIDNFLNTNVGKAMHDNVKRMLESYGPHIMGSLRDAQVAKGLHPDTAGQSVSPKLIPQTLSSVGMETTPAWQTRGAGVASPLSALGQPQQQ